MEIKNFMFIIGSVLFGLGMAVAAVIKIKENHVVPGVFYIIVTVFIIVLCALPLIYKKGK